MKGFEESKQLVHVRVFWDQGNKGINFRGTGEQRLNFEGNTGTETILRNREHRKHFFDFSGTGEQANLFQGNKGTGIPPGRASMMEHKLFTMYKIR